MSKERRLCTQKRRRRDSDHATAQLVLESLIQELPACRGHVTHMDYERQTLALPTTELFLFSLEPIFAGVRDPREKVR